MSRKEKKVKKTKDGKPKQNHILVWIAAAVVLIPTIFVGVVVMTSTENQGEPVTGVRFLEEDLNPAITEEQITQVQEAMTFDYVESVEVNLKSATLRVNINMEDIVDEVDLELVQNTAQSAYDAIAEILPIDTYFTQKDDGGKMYDLSINVYNYAQIDDEHTADHQVYVCLTKTSASDESVMDVLTQARDSELADSVMNGSAQ